MRDALRGVAMGALLFALAGTVPAARATTAPTAPHIEVCFVLDTTGSMGALIEGAKQKIWSIANQMASAKPAPEIRFGLIGYRDRGDAYITRVFDLTTDLDAIYVNLMAFQAQGGGDMPESVNQALHESVSKISWSRDRETLRVIFLVGDAPPHTNYDDDVPYAETARRAAAADIVINTIQVGKIAQTTPFWQEIASKADGQFVQIDQTGNMRTVSTPMDNELARLSGQLSLTVVPYGDARTQAAITEKNANAQRAAGGRGAARGDAGAASAADRLTFMNAEAAAAGARSVVTGEGELIRDIANGKIKLEDVKESDLPPNMQEMTVSERQEFVGDLLVSRKELQRQVDELSRQRENYIKEELKKQTDSFDEKVAEIIRTQARKKGISYDNPAPEK